MTFHAAFDDRVQETGDEALLNASLDYDNRYRNIRGTRLRISSEAKKKELKEDQETGVDESNENSIANQLEVDHANQYADTKLFVRDYHADKGSSTNIGINAATSFLLTAVGAAASANPAETEAVLISEVESETTESELDCRQYRQPGPVQ